MLSSSATGLGEIFLFLLLHKLHWNSILYAVSKELIITTQQHANKITKQEKIKTKNKIPKSF